VGKRRGKTGQKVERLRHLQIRNKREVDTQYFGGQFNAPSSKKIFPRLSSDVYEMKKGAANG
jgi:hypothetical protein